jgi:hypothetical protein
MREVFVLMADDDGTIWSRPEPFGVAVTTESEAQRFVKEGRVGYSQCYFKIKVFDNMEEAIEWRFERE